MTFLATSDPLALLAIQAGQINAPSTAAAAQGSTDLDVAQRFAQIGEPVPIVFARFRNSKGGILISPAAAEARFENDASNNVTAYYMLVLGEGQMSSIPVKDVFQRACRVGSHSQTYDRRAGTWTPGNYLVQRAGKDLPVAPFYCGSVGSYPDITTLSFNVTIPDGFDQYNRQVHLFIRGGMPVTRIYDSTLGPSDNFVDLAKWLVVNTSRLPAAMIDDASLLTAATFLEVNALTCNIEINKSSNYSDLIAKLAPYFLLTESEVGGKFGLRPLLPITDAGAIKTTAISAEYTFTEDTVLPGSLDINYLSLADRQPVVVQAIWRQQLESDIGIIRTAEVRYANTAENGPYESHDLSEFCTSEDHAVKVAAYILAKRIYTTHTIRFTAKPQAHNTIISKGDIIRVRLERSNSTYANSVHDYLYQVERVTKTLAGDVSYEATHFPIDDQGRSLLALDVAAAVGTGIILASGRTGVSCDVNSSSDNTIPAETFTEVAYDSPYELPLNEENESPLDEVQVLDDQLDDEPYPAHRYFPSDRPVELGTALYPFGTPPGEESEEAPCGANNLKSIIWYKDGTRLVTINYDASTDSYTYDLASGQRMPTFLDDATTPGVLIVGIEGNGTYTSITNCVTGVTGHGRTTVVNGRIDASTIPQTLTYIDEYGYTVTDGVPAGYLTSDVYYRYRVTVYTLLDGSAYLIGDEYVTGDNTTFANVIAASDAELVPPYDNGTCLQAINIIRQSSIDPPGYEDVYFYGGQYCYTTASNGELGFASLVGSYPVMLVKAYDIRRIDPSQNPPTEAVIFKVAVANGADLTVNVTIQGGAATGI